MRMGALLFPLRCFPDDPAEVVGRVKTDLRANHPPFIINNKGGHAARTGIGPTQAFCLWKTGHPKPPNPGLPANTGCFRILLAITLPNPASACLIQSRQKWS